MPNYTLAGSSVLIDIPSDPTQNSQYTDLRGFALKALAISPDSDIDMATVEFADVNGITRQFTLSTETPLIYNLPNGCIVKSDGTDSPRLFRSTAVNTWFQAVNGVFGTWSWDQDEPTQLPRLKLRGYFTIADVPLPKIRANKQRYMRVSSGLQTTVIARLPTFGRKFIGVSALVSSGTLTLRTEGIMFNRAGGTIDLIRYRFGSTSVGTTTLGLAPYMQTNDRQYYAFDALEISGVFSAGTIAHISVECGDMPLRIV